MGSNKCHTQKKVEERKSMGAMRRNARNIKPLRREKKATSIKLESIFETIQRINRLERPSRHGKRN